MVSLSDAPVVKSLAATYNELVDKDFCATCVPSIKKVTSELVQTIR